MRGVDETVRLPADAYAPEATAAVYRRIGDKARRDMSEQPEGEGEVAARERQRRPALVAAQPVGARRLDLGPDRSAQAHEQRQGGETSERLGRLGGEIAVEEPVRRPPQAPLLEVHEEEGEVVEHVGARDRVGELDRERRRALPVSYTHLTLPTILRV